MRQINSKASRHRASRKEAVLPGKAPTKRSGARRGPGTAPATRAGETKRLLLVDGHPIVRRGLSELINHQSGLAVCGETSSGRQAIELVSRLRPDLVVLDITLSDINGIELVKNLKAIAPSLLIMVLSMHDEVVYGERALRAGARGYIMKTEPGEGILEAIRTVLQGEIYLSSGMKRRLLQHLVEGPIHSERFTIADLSDRELEVFQLLGNGFGTRQIAARLNLSVKTIESYRESLKRKMQLPSGAELVRRAVQWARSEAATL